MNARKRLQQLIESTANVRFGAFVQVVESFRFTHLRTSSSHHIYGHPAIAEQLNLQEVKGKSKGLPNPSVLEARGEV